ncbi:sugar ABC transporter substrate-binding protein [Streptomyces sp. B6B3]|uniref:ABC transporter substrate-binding protein n=1 Tax=Streptomyces sp. B6B3 TaxID=3153570 RepID=UPI00325C99CD
MRTRKARVVAAVGVTAAALLLPGCAKGPAGGGVTLQMVESLTNPVRTELLEQLLEDFEAEHPDIDVELVSPPTNQADNKLQQMLQSGSGVDVLEVRDTTVGPWSTNGWLHDMSGDLKDWGGWDALTDNATAAAEDAEGHTYFLPYGFYGLSLFYRTDLVEEAGFDEPPATWEDLLEQASAIQDEDSRQYGYAFRGGLGAAGNVTAAIQAYVADAINPENGYQLADGGSIFSAPEAEDALRTYFALFDQAAPPSSVSWGYPEMVEGFSNGSTAFLLQDPEVIASVRESNAVDEDQWSTAPLVTGPSGKAVQPLATAGWGVAESSSHRAEAMQLVRFLAEGEASLTFSKENSLVPILDGAAEDEFYRTGPWASYVTMTEESDTYITVTEPRDAPWWTEWAQKADSEVQSVLLGDMSPAELLDSWDTYWTEKWQNES